jgi:hypothetical protein
MRFHFDERKSKRLKANPKRGIGFEEAQEIFSHPYYLDQRSDMRSSAELSVGWEKVYMRLSLRCEKTKKESITTS